MTDYLNFSRLNFMQYVYGGQSSLSQEFGYGQSSESFRAGHYHAYLNLNDYKEYNCLFYNYWCKQKWRVTMTTNKYCKNKVDNYSFIDINIIIKFFVSPGCSNVNIQ